MTEFFYSRRTFEEVFQPTISDLQEEYLDALAERRPWKARWVKVRGIWSFFSAVLLQTFTGVGKYLVRFLRANA
jgi:hypothetical protein